MHGRRGSLSCEQMAELSSSYFSSSNQLGQLTVQCVASPKAVDSPFTTFSCSGFVANTLITDADIITFPDVYYHSGD